MNPLILASKSHSRRAMLEAAGVDFESMPAEVDERGLEAGLGAADPEAIARALAAAKALAVSKAAPGRLVLGSDSLVEVAGRRFDKPASRADAARHLRFFSGKTMHLHSAAALVRDENVVWSHSAVAKLQVIALSDDFIDRYLDHEWPQVSGCVGVFRIEGRGVQLFHAIEGDHFTVLGMPLLAVLGALREFGELPGVTQPYAEVIGDPIAQSKSPAIHNFWLRKLGTAGEYGRTRVTSGGLADYLSGTADNANWRGCNVTMPHKQTIMPLLGRLDPLAERIGAVNTVVREADGTLTGYNTDAAGFIEPLAPLLAERHLFRMARVLGTGGAARAIVAALSDRGFVIVLAGRDPAKAQALLDELARGSDHHAVDIAHFAPATDFAFDDREGCLDLIVNASPLGMAGNPPLAFDFSHAPPASLVYDIVTHPLETPLLRKARAAGLRTVDGLAMLIGQAAAAFERFFGMPAPREHDAELRALLTS